MTLAPRCRSPRAGKCWLAGGLVFAALLLVAPQTRAQEKTRIAVLPTKVLKSAKGKVPDILDDVLITAVQHAGAYEVIGQDDINDMLGFEQKKQLLGCDELSCMAEVGGALGVEKLLVMKVARVKDKWVCTTKLINIQQTRVEQRATNYIPGDVVALLEKLPQVVAKLFAGGGIAESPASAQSPARDVPAATTPESTPADETALLIFEERIRDGKYAGDSDVFSQRIAWDGQRLFEGGRSNLAVANSPTQECQAVALPDGKGGAFVVFEKKDSDTGDMDIYAQRIDVHGKRLWHDGKRSVMVAASNSPERNPVAVPDGSGGFLVVFERHIKSGEHAGDIDVGAQRVGPDGTLKWEEGRRSVNVAASTLLESDPAAIPDGNGGAIVAYVIESKEEGKGGAGVYAQRITRDGKRQWEKTVLVAETEHDELAPSIVSDGRGGAIVVFEQHLAKDGVVTDTDLFAQRVSGSGKLLWEEGRRSKVVSTSKYLERDAVVVPDGRGGIIVVFEQENAPGDEAHMSVYAQRLNGDGVMQWNEGKRSIMVANTKNLDRNPVAVSDGAGGAIVIFEHHMKDAEGNDDVDISAQRVSAAGTLLWEEGKRSKRISATTQVEWHPSAIADGRGGAIIVFERRIRGGEYDGDIDLYGERLDKNGNRLWFRDNNSLRVVATKHQDVGVLIVPHKQALWNP